jgi:hypothetical protein
MEDKTGYRVMVEHNGAPEIVELNLTEDDYKGEFWRLIKSVDNGEQNSKENFHNFCLAKQKEQLDMENYINSPSIELKQIRLSVDEHAVYNKSVSELEKMTLLKGKSGLMSYDSVIALNVLRYKYENKEITEQEFDRIAKNHFTANKGIPHPILKSHESFDITPEGFENVFLRRDGNNVSILPIDQMINSENWYCQLLHKFNNRTLSDGTKISVEVKNRKDLEAKVKESFSNAWTEKDIWLRFRIKGGRLLEKQKTSMILDNFIKDRDFNKKSAALNYQQPESDKRIENYFINIPKIIYNSSKIDDMEDMSSTCIEKYIGKNLSKLKDEPFDNSSFQKISDDFKELKLNLEAYREAKKRGSILDNMGMLIPSRNSYNYKRFTINPDEQIKNVDEAIKKLDKLRSIKQKEADDNTRKLKEREEEKRKWEEDYQRNRKEIDEKDAESKREQIMQHEKREKEYREKCRKDDEERAKTLIKVKERKEKRQAEVKTQLDNLGAASTVFRDNKDVLSYSMRQHIIREKELQNLNKEIMKDPSKLFKKEGDSVFTPTLDMIPDERLPFCHYDITPSFLENVKIVFVDAYRGVEIGGYGINNEKDKIIVLINENGVKKEEQLFLDKLKKLHGDGLIPNMYTCDVKGGDYKASGFLSHAVFDEFIKYNMGIDERLVKGDNKIAKEMADARENEMKLAKLKQQERQRMESIRNIKSRGIR